MLSETYARLSMGHAKKQTEKDLLDMLKEFERLDTLLTNIRDLINTLEWSPNSKK